MESSFSIQVAMSQQEKQGGKQSTAKEPIGTPSLI
jgi:hypothetical protein